MTTKKIPLTLEQAEDIRSQHKNGITQTELAKIYKVSQTTIGRIILNKRFAVEPECEASPKDSDIHGEIDLLIAVYREDGYLGVEAKNRARLLAEKLNEENPGDEYIDKVRLVIAG